MAAGARFSISAINTGYTITSAINILDQVNGER
jgi:hypothetical protein